MTNPFYDNDLTREKLRKIVRAARQYVEQDEPNTDAPIYNWHEPHHFNPDGLFALDHLGKKIAVQIKKTFETYCQGEFEVEISSITQQFANSLAEEVSAEMESYYFLPFMDSRESDCGFISISRETAFLLVGQMLRDSEINASEREELTELEDSVLLDITTAVVESMNTIFQQYESEIKKKEKFIKGEWPLDFNAMEDMTLIEFTVSYPEGSLDARYVILSEILDNVLGLEYEIPKMPPKDKFRDVIISKLNEIPIDIEARICDTLINMQDMVNVEAGDIILLGKRVSETLDVLMNGQRLVKAHPAVCEGKYAVVISQEDEI